MSSSLSLLLLPSLLSVKSSSDKSPLSSPSFSKLFCSVNKKALAFGDSVFILLFGIDNGGEGLNDVCVASFGVPGEGELDDTGELFGRFNFPKGMESFENGRPLFAVGCDVCLSSVTRGEGDVLSLSEGTTFDVDKLIELPIDPSLSERDGTAGLEAVSALVPSSLESKSSSSLEYSSSIFFEAGFVSLFVVLGGVLPFKAVEGMVSLKEGGTGEVDVGVAPTFNFGMDSEVGTGLASSIGLSTNTGEEVTFCSVVSTLTSVLLVVFDVRYFSGENPNELIMFRKPLMKATAKS